MKTHSKVLLISILIASLLLEGCLMAGRKAVDKMDGSDQTQQTQGSANYTD